MWIIIAVVAVFIGLPCIVGTVLLALGVAGAFLYGVSSHEAPPTVHESMHDMPTQVAPETPEIRDEPKLPEIPNPDAVPDRVP